MAADAARQPALAGAERPVAQSAAKYDRTISIRRAADMRPSAARISCRRSTTYAPASRGAGPRAAVRRIVELAASEEERRSAKRSFVATWISHLRRSLTVPTSTPRMPLLEIVAESMRKR